MLSSTYSIPWPPFYEKIIDAFAAINIDISMIRQVGAPLADAARWSSGWKPLVSSPTPESCDRGPPVRRAACACPCQPLNQFFGLLGGTLKNSMCNFNDMNAATMFSPCCAWVCAVCSTAR